MFGYDKEYAKSKKEGEGCWCVFQRQHERGSFGFVLLLILAWLKLQVTTQDNGTATGISTGAEIEMFL